MSQKRGIDIKSNFHILFKLYKDKQMIRNQQLAKQAANYENKRAETSKFEQKPIARFDESNYEEELEMKKLRKKKIKSEKGHFIAKKKKPKSALKNSNKIKEKKSSCGKNLMNLIRNLNKSIRMRKKKPKRCRQLYYKL